MPHSRGLAPLVPKLHLDTNQWEVWIGLEEEDTKTRCDETNQLITKFKKHTEQNLFVLSWGNRRNFYH